MKRSQILIPAAIIVVIAVFLILRGRQQSAEVNAKLASKPVVQATKSSDAPIKPVATPEKTPDVFFLSEAGAGGTRSAGSSIKLPKTNGSRRVADSRAITSAEEGDFLSPHWSPDGLELLFSKPGFSGLYTKGINGGEITQVTGKEHIGFNANWSADGQIETRTNAGEKQAFTADGAPVDSVAMEQDTSRVGTYTKDDTVYYRANPGEAAVPLTSGDDRFYGGKVSPDGKYVAYNGLHTGLYIQPLDGSSPPVHVGIGEQPSWLPDSSGIVYSVTEDDGHTLIAGDLYLASRDGGTISNLTESPGTVELYPTVSPDGSRIAFEAGGRIHVGSLH